MTRSATLLGLFLALGLQACDSAPALQPIETAPALTSELNCHIDDGGHLLTSDKTPGSNSASTVPGAYSRMNAGSSLYEDDGYVREGQTDCISGPTRFGGDIVVDLDTYEGDADLYLYAYSDQRGHSVIMSSVRAHQESDRIIFSERDIPSWAERFVICVRGFRSSRYYVDIRQDLARSENRSPVYVDLDLRTYEEESSYYMIFSAERTRLLESGDHSPGHGFVTWAVYDQERHQTRATASGLYGLPDEWSFGPGVPTEFRDEAVYGDNDNVTVRFAIQVNREAFYNSQSIRGNWGTGRYWVLTNDCITYLAAVAESASLDTPNRAFNWFPSTYVSQLREINT